jgi:D-inositol-3-phosphate glycosyltransferase
LSDEPIVLINPQSYTGIGYYDYSLCEALSGIGVQVELCSSDRWLCRSYKRHFKYAPVYQRCSGNMSKFLKGVNYARSTVKMLNYSIKSRARVFHFSIVELPPVDLVLMTVLKLLGKRIVYTPHDIIHFKKYPLNNFFSKALYKLSDRIIVHNSANVDTIVSTFKSDAGKIRVIPHGGYEYFINGALSKVQCRKKLGIKDKDRLLLFFGHLRKGKGLNILLDAMPAIIQSCPDAKLIIAGKVSKEISAEWVRSETERKDLSHNVILRLEFIPDSEIQCYYTASDLVMVPYTNISESGVLRYAMTCGRPVLCSDLKEFGETVIHGKTGFVFRNGDHEDLAKKTIAALSDPTIEEIGQNGRKAIANKYSWAGIAMETRKIYYELIGKR